MTKIPYSEIERAIQDEDNIGFCLSCGEEQSGCEPDARNYTCESCGEKQVFGASEIVLCHDEHIDMES